MRFHSENLYRNNLLPFRYNNKVENLYNYCHFASNDEDVGEKYFSDYQNNLCLRYEQNGIPYYYTNCSIYSTNGIIFDGLCSNLTDYWKILYTVEYDCAVKYYPKRAGSRASREAIIIYKYCTDENPERSTYLLFEDVAPFSRIDNFKLEAELIKNTSLLAMVGYISAEDEKYIFYMIMDVTSGEVLYKWCKSQSELGYDIPSYSTIGNGVFLANWGNPVTIAYI